MRTPRALFPLLALIPLAVACSSQSHAGGEDDPITSITARSRTLKFQGAVFVDENASDDDILYTVRKQTQSAFGALRTADVGVNSRELKDVDPTTFVKTKVTVIDTSKDADPGTTMLRVTYTYTDNALVPATRMDRSTMSLGLLGAGYAAQNQRILKECTDNDSGAREFLDSIWYVFNPSLDSCRQAISAEQQQIDGERAKLPAPQGDEQPKFTLAETKRLYIPMTAALEGDNTNSGKSYPEYDRLYAGGVQPGKLVIGMVSGMMADWAAGEHHDTIEDEGYGMWFAGLNAILAARPELAFVKTEPAEDIGTYDLAGDVHVTGVTFSDILNWESGTGEFPEAVRGDEDKQHALRVAVGNKLAKHWVTFEAPMTVTIGGEAKDLTIVLQTYFGAETDGAPHRRGIKTSDVFVYNGHSYIGYGPLDPSRFHQGDFPDSYQLLAINGCVSYNYYEKDYFPLKTGGTKNMELITNGLESWVNESGPAMGRLVGALIDGKLNSYTDILAAAQFTGHGYAWGKDALRVVDGELDNVYSPDKTPITLAPRP